MLYSSFYRHEIFVSNTSVIYLSVQFSNHFVQQIYFKFAFCHP
jgi:hypothetical protein